MLEKYNNEIEELCNELRRKIIHLDTLYIRSGQIDSNSKDMAKFRELYKRELDTAGYLMLLLKQVQDSASINIAKWGKNDEQ